MPNVSAQFEPIGPVQPAVPVADPHLREKRLAQPTLTPSIKPPKTTMPLGCHLYSDCDEKAA